MATGCYRRLWAAVLEQAVKDARGGRTYHIITEEARAWFRSKKEGMGSFIWVCRILDLDPGYVRRKVDQQPIVRPAWRSPERRHPALQVTNVPMSRTGPDLPIRIAQ